MFVRFVLMTSLALTMPTIAAAGDLDPYLPPDTESYLSVNVKQILTSKAGKRLGTDSLKAALGTLDEPNAILKELGVDPFKDVEQIQLASPKVNEADRGLIIVTGKFDGDALKKKADDAKEEAEPKVRARKVSLGNKEFTTIYEMNVKGQEGSRFLVILDNKTLLASGGKDYVVEALKQAHAKKKPTLKNEQVQAVLEKLDSKLSLAVVSRGGALPQHELLELVPKNIRDALDSVEVIGGGTLFSNEVKFELVGTCKTNEDAATLRDLAGRGVALIQVGLKFVENNDKSLTLLREVLDTAKVGGRGKIITFNAKLSADVLDDIAK